MKLLYKKGQKVRYLYCLANKPTVKKTGTIIKACAEYRTVPAHYHLDNSGNFVLPEEIIGAA